jgi:hemerythrin-like domain-containing protein
MDPIENLKAEHERILLMVDVLERMSEKIGSGESVQTDHLEQVLEFLEIFAGKRHQDKEDEYLFTAIREAGGPAEEGLIAAMLSEHSRGRGFIEEMKKLLDHCKKGEPGSLMVLTTPALQYVNLIESHIWKENNILFPIAEKIVSADTLASLAGKYDKFDEEVPQGTNEEFRETIEKLSKIYRRGC